MVPKEPGLSSQAPGGGKVDVSAVLVNYRSALETVEAVEALLETAGGLSVQVLVVENQSGGEDLDILRKRLPGEVELLVSPANLGFAGGIELAVPRAAGKYLLLLNPDARLQPGALGLLVKFLEEREDAGVVGPLLLEPDGSLQASGRRLPSPGLLLGVEIGICGLHEEIPDPPAPFPTGWVVGACMLIRKKAYDRVGGMDTAYFLYFEETDLCRRMKEAGWGVWCHPLARCVHDHGTSAERAGQDLKGGDITRFYFPSRRRYLTKFHGKGWALAVEGGLFALVLLRWAKALVFGLWSPRARARAGARREEARAFWALWTGKFTRTAGDS